MTVIISNVMAGECVVAANGVRLEKIRQKKKCVCVGGKGSAVCFFSTGSRGK